MRYHNYLLAFCFLIALGACDDILEQEPQTQIAQERAITNKKGAEAAVAGMYNELQDADYYGRNFQIMSDISSDVAQSIGTWDFYREMDTYLTSIGNTENGNFWTRAYRAVNVANNIIDKVPQLTDAQDLEKNSYLGQAYFVRALAFFDLTKTYGGVPGVIGTLGVPLVTKPSARVDESFFPSRPTLAESYKQVEKDLLMAIELLPEQHASDVATRSQAVKGTARALLSRLYLYTNQPENVIKYADLVIADPKYRFVANYLDIFQSKFTTEAIFELNFNSTDQNGLRNWYVPSTIGGRGDVAAHTSFYQEVTANPNDIRGKLFAYNSGAKVYYPTKYIKSGNIDNSHIIRLSEVYLNRAEARAKTGNIAGALSDLNAIRRNAGLGNITTTGTEETLKAIWQERKVELAFEGHSFFDIVRTGQTSTELRGVERTNGPAVSLLDLNRQVFPIPSFDIDSNKNLVQNEAYK
ncbi:hypothetical protein TH63_17315 [Rufibacter radiotolerans]|uniref:RagB/SusD family nutrient uptake outer membrane protein n=1 Tax=Rufibacter radiotolerans TaxID=1379910 RepID=A0A0H4VVC0_9BACT|nr:RagB/SusD family nutrient uptake outer membrane protein [Rufibacter radiotolerans]AKQ47794.1 hypothetical protein TH63_17315 [Rufibacter radiotolerans]